jgi:hypothetical protein
MAAVHLAGLPESAKLERAAAVPVLKGFANWGELACSAANAVADYSYVHRSVWAVACRKKTVQWLDGTVSADMMTRSPPRRGSRESGMIFGKLVGEVLRENAFA